MTGKLPAWTLLLFLFMPAMSYSLERDDRRNSKELAYRAGFDDGFRDGFRNGTYDFRARAGFDYRGRDRYGAGGYRAWPYGHGDRYRKGYKDGYRQGYRQGFAPHGYPGYSYRHRLGFRNY